MNVPVISLSIVCVVLAATIVWVFKNAYWFGKMAGLGEQFTYIQQILRKYGYDIDTSRPGELLNRDGTPVDLPEMSVPR